MVMALDNLDDNAIRGVLSRVRRIALVGASKKPERPANHVQAVLQAHGFQVTPVNPGLAGQTLHGQIVVGSIAEAVPLEMVDLFRASEHVPSIVDEAIALGAKVIWMQLGVISQSAARRARDAGLTVVMDRCPVIEIRRLGLRAA